jgi:hypothetical protein
MTSDSNKVTRTRYRKSTIARTTIMEIVYREVSEDYYDGLLTLWVPLIGFV